MKTRSDYINLPLRSQQDGQADIEGKFVTHRNTERDKDSNVERKKLQLRSAIDTSAPIEEWK